MLGLALKLCAVAIGLGGGLFATLTALVGASFYRGPEKLFIVLASRSLWDLPAIAMLALWWVAGRVAPQAPPSACHRADPSRSPIHGTKRPVRAAHSR